jgi:hypothetical protein
MNKEQKEALLVSSGVSAYGIVLIILTVVLT